MVHFWYLVNLPYVGQCAVWDFYLSYQNAGTLHLEPVKKTAGTQCAILLLIEIKYFSEKYYQVR